MKNKNYVKLLALIVAINSIFTSCSKNNTEKEDIQAFIDEVNNSQKYEFYRNAYIPNIENEISKLGIVDDSVHPYENYRVLRFIDQNGIEKISIIEPFINYLTDEEGSYMGEEYLLYGIFKQRLVIVLNSKSDKGRMTMDIENHEETGYIKKIISINGLDDLKNVAAEYGFDEEYINSVFGSEESMKGRLLSVSDVARIYVAFVSPFHREIFDNDELVLKK